MNARLTLASLAALVVPLALAPLPVAAQSALPLGAVTSGMVVQDAPGVFEVKLDGPGFLSVMVRSESQEDLILSVTDDEGQVLLDGRSDTDRAGDMSAEQLMVQIPWSGLYRVVVDRNYGMGSVSFDVGASFLPTELAAVEPDPDGKPSTAMVLSVGDGHEDTIDPALGDGWDWYRVTAEKPGVLTVLTRAVGGDSGDLRLEVFREGELSEPVDNSDQDQEGVLANETVTISVSAGETVYVKVGPSFMGGARVSYRVANGLIG